jgi:hypothetical protein
VVTADRETGCAFGPFSQPRSFDGSIYGRRQRSTSKKDEGLTAVDDDDHTLRGSKPRASLWMLDISCASCKNERGLRIRFVSWNDIGEQGRVFKDAEYLLELKVDRQLSSRQEAGQVF